MGAGAGGVEQGIGIRGKGVGFLFKCCYIS